MQTQMQTEVRPNFLSKTAADRPAPLADKKPIAEIVPLNKKMIRKVMEIMSFCPEAYPSHYLESKEAGSMKNFLEYIAFNQSGFALLRDNEIIGHIAYYRDFSYFDAPIYEKRALVVHPKYQGLGYGKMLVRHVEEKIKALNGKVIWLVTGKENEKFYLSLGYKSGMVEPDFWSKGKDLLLFHKRLIQ